AVDDFPAPVVAAPRYAFKCNLSSATAHDSRPPLHYTRQWSGLVTPVQQSSDERLISAHDAGKTLGAGLRDLDGKNVADEARLRLCVDGLQIRRAADELPGATAELLEPHRKDLADAAGVEPSLLGLEQLLQPGQPIRLDLLRQLAVDVGGRRAGARAVLERERLGEADLPHQVERLLELFLRLAGKPDDDVGG